MGKKNKGQKIEAAPKTEIEEVDVEALNSEAEDLIGADEDSTEDSSEPVSYTEPDLGQDSDSDESSQEDQGDGAEIREPRFLGYDVITKEKVYG